MTINKHVLLVEGRDDREVVYQFCNHHNIDNKSNFLVQDKEGFDPLMDDLSVRIRTDINVLGIIVDADLDIAARWQSIKDLLAGFGYLIPDAPVDAGLIVIHEKPPFPKVGVWLMPNNQIGGMLEDFLLMLTDANDPLVDRALQAVNSIPNHERRFKECHLRKALIHTWLAWQENPGTPLGQAITKHYLDPTKEPAPSFKRWLLRLFDVPN